MESRSPTELLFVYGTLRIGFDNPFARRLRAEASFLGRARFPSAILVDLGSYPGLLPVTDPSKAVVGDLFGLPGGKSGLLEALDAYEGCSNDPERPGEYRREARPVLLTDRTSRLAWTYLIHRETRNLPRVPKGNYLEYKGLGRSRACRAHSPKPG